MPIEIHREVYKKRDFSVEVLYLLEFSNCGYLHWVSDKSKIKQQFGCSKEESPAKVSTYKHRYKDFDFGILTFAHILNHIIFMVWYIHTGILYIQEYYSTLKRKEILSFATTWMNLGGIMLHEINKKEKDTACYHLYVKLKKKETN